MRNLVFVDGGNRRICRLLVKLIAQSRPVEAVHAKELGVLDERTCRIVLNEVREVAFSGIEIPLVVVCHCGVELHRIVLRSAADRKRNRLEELHGLGIFAAVVILESRLVLCFHVGAFEKLFVL